VKGEEQRPTKAHAPGAHWEEGENKRENTKMKNQGQPTMTTKARNCFGRRTSESRSKNTKDREKVEETKGYSSRSERAKEGQPVRSTQV